MIKALSVPLKDDLKLFCLYLHQRGIFHKTSEERGRQVIWVQNQTDLELVNHYFNKWKSGNIEEITAPASSTFTNKKSLRRTVLAPLTVTIIFISCAITGLFNLFPETLGWFTFTDPYLPFNWVNIHGTPDTGIEKLTALTDILTTTLFKGQWWRLFTPVFLHFSLMHIAFNAAMFFFFGQRIERVHGKGKFLALIIFTALVSNLVQYFTGNVASIFGGLSGIIYGFIGFCWIRSKERVDGYGIPKGLYYFMIGWLVLGYIGILNHLGLGLIANGAHGGGLVAGMIVGFITAKKQVHN